MIICRVFVRNFSKKSIPLIKHKPKSNTSFHSNFVDVKKIKVFGGKGGDGCISLASVFRVEFAGPDGGDGGNGGHVIFKANHNLNSLSNLSTIIKGKFGEKGRNENCHGLNAEPTIVDVPFGTIFKDESGIKIADLDSEDNALFLAAKGGSGGKGNKFFATSENQAPEFSEKGAQGEIKVYNLELSTIAHIGLVGFPNAGKSTLLQAITRARPKVASYPFTTLKPYVGMVMYDDLEQVAIADIPGIIEDAHKNKGLGIAFLKHIQRCLCYLYIIDLSSPNPWNELQILYNEIEEYDPSMLEKPSIIIANKMDLPESINNFETFKKQVGSDKKILPISAKTGINLRELLNQIRTFYDEENAKLLNKYATKKSDVESLFKIKWSDWKRPTKI